MADAKLIDLAMLLTGGDVKKDKEEGTPFLEQEPSSLTREGFNSPRLAS